MSGNVSLYNETDGVGIPPTPVVGGIGLIEDVSRIATLKGAQIADELIILGETHGHLGASLFAREILGLEAAACGAAPPTDLEAARSVCGLVRDLIARGLVNAVHDISDGGMACAAAEMALAGDIGVTFGADEKHPISDFAALFGEDQNRFLLAVSRDQLGGWNDLGLTPQSIGYFGGEAVTLLLGARDGPTVDIPLATLRAAHEGWLPAYMKGEG